MKKEVQAVLNLIQDLGIENEIFHALGEKSAERSVVEVISKPKKTSNGFEIYYDESSGDAVGIVYKNLVFLKTTSKKRLSWEEAADYCKTIVVNGIVSEFCPVTEKWKDEFKEISSYLYNALTEIGAEKLDCVTWCNERPKCYSWNLPRYHAWTLCFSSGHIKYDHKDYHRYVRPVLVLKS